MYKSIFEKVYDGSVNENSEFRRLFHTNPDGFPVANDLTDGSPPSGVKVDLGGGYFGVVLVDGEGDAYYNRVTLVIVDPSDEREYWWLESIDGVDKAKKLALLVYKELKKVKDVKKVAKKFRFTYVGF